MEDVLAIYEKPLSDKAPAPPDEARTTSAPRLRI